jgi:two-component system chemotaxis response regulator CheY
MALRLLICDDSQLARRSVLKAIPVDLSVTVLEANDGSKALELCRAGAVDLVVLDLNMPTMDGFTVLQTLKDEGIKLPVVVVTANIQVEASQRARDLGARAVVQKPLDPKKIETLVRHFATGKD